MYTGGDEFYRTQYGNNNPYNLDSEKNWLNWSDLATNRVFFDFAPDHPLPSRPPRVSVRRSSLRAWITMGTG